MPMAPISFDTRNWSRFEGETLRIDLADCHLRPAEQFKNNHLFLNQPISLKIITEMCSGSEAGSYLRLIDSCITPLEAQGASRTCNESEEEEQEATACSLSAGSGVCCGRAMSVQLSI